MTPEGKIKALTNKFLKSHGLHPASKAVDFPKDALGWFYYPSQNGFGVSGIPDVMGVYKGRLFALELKAPGRRGQEFRGCSPHQHHQLNAIRQCGGYAAVVDGEADLAEFEEWLRGL